MDIYYKTLHTSASSGGVVGAVLGSLLEDAYGEVGVSARVMGVGDDIGEEGGGNAGDEPLNMMMVMFRRRRQ